MKKELIERLSRITEEEQNILDEKSGIERSIYTSDRNFTVDSRRMLKEGSLIRIRTHTRFIPFPKHTHNYVEMVYMVEGETSHTIDGTDVLLKKGEILLMNQHATQEIAAAGMDDIAVNFIILPQFFDQTLKMMGLTESPLRDFIVNCLKSSQSPTSFLHFKVSEVVPIENLMENLILSLLSETSDPYTDELTMGLLFVHLLSHTEKIDRGGSSYDQDLVFDVLRYISTNYRDASLTNYVSGRHLDITRLSKTTKKYTGFTYRELLWQQRMAKACELLSTTSLNIEEIASAVGYDNVSFFHRLFKKYYNMSPRSYRLMMAEQSSRGNDHS